MLGAVLAVALGSASGVSGLQPNTPDGMCFDPGLCLGTPGCLPIATSLPTLGNSNFRGEYDPANRSCGSKRYLVILRRGCGAPLATPTCNWGTVNEP
jgi:hypothetical protein